MPKSQSATRIEWAVRALAQDARTQRALFPDFVCKGDEMALDFEEALRAVLSEGTDWTQEQVASLLKLDGFIESCSGLANQELWLDENVLDSSPIWAEIRRIAAEVVALMGWPTSPPPVDRHAYIKS